MKKGRNTRCHLEGTFGTVCGKRKNLPTNFSSFENIWYDPHLVANVGKGWRWFKWQAISFLDKCKYVETSLRHAFNLILLDNLQVLEEVRDAANIKKYATKLKASKKYNSKLMLRRMQNNDMVLKRITRPSQTSKLYLKIKGKARIAHIRSLDAG